MKRILISVCGIGLGHATRIHAVINELKKAKDVELKIVSYGAGYDYLKSQGIETTEIPGYLYKGKYTFSVLMTAFDLFKDPTRLRGDYYAFLEAIKDFKPDIVFSDSEPNAFFYAYRRKLPNLMLTNLISTINNFQYIPKAHLNQSIIMQRLLVERLVEFIKKRAKLYAPAFESKLHYRDNVAYTDLVLREKPEDLQPEQELRSKLAIDKPFYYVNIGQSDIEKYLLELLLKNLPKFKDKNFIVSSNSVSKKTVNGNITIYPFLSNALEYIKTCEGIISAAGHSTISEAICFKKPILVIPVRNHIEQMTNAALLEHEKLGLACYLGQKNEAEDVYESLKKFFAQQEEIKARLLLSKIKGAGAAQIAKDILNH